jgi:hypothetical protein
MAELPAERASQPRAGNLSTTRISGIFVLKTSYKYTNLFYFSILYTLGEREIII